MFGRMETRKRIAVDPLGRLCEEGHEVASYLFQVPDDSAQWKRMSQILTGIIDEAQPRKHGELTRIAAELKEASQNQPSPQLADMLQGGFDRMIKLWQAATSGIF